MASTDIRGILTAFNPSLDFFAITTGDGRVKVWDTLKGQRKRKHLSSLLVLGTGSGDVLALDVSAGQLSWKLSDCHPGGVRAISSSANASCIYTAGARWDDMHDRFMNGNVLRNFKASSKAVSCMTVSSGNEVNELLLGYWVNQSASDICT
ncbi:WD40/YVTN repeat-like-containing domain superfamily [Sesbania bispinosa]|nr:WD40/YVTN repeat-like-containing domain superfamily [Sesbania bispinosa]